MWLLVRGEQVVPPGQSPADVVQDVPWASQRQMGRHFLVIDISLQSRPGAQSVLRAQLAPAWPMRVPSGQAQSTWSMLPRARQASPAGQPLTSDPAAARRGSQLNVQVW